MARGGKREGAGRPRGSKDKVPSPEVLAEAVGLDLSTLTPLEMMLAIMRHSEMPPALRIQMAMAAAPYCHARPTDTKGGKKEERAEAARKAGGGKYAPPPPPGAGGKTAH